MGLNLALIRFSFFLLSVSFVSPLYLVSIQCLCVPKYVRLVLTRCWSSLVHHQTLKLSLHQSSRSCPTISSIRFCDGCVPISYFYASDVKLSRVYLGLILIRHGTTIQNVTRRKSTGYSDVLSSRAEDTHPNRLDPQRSHSCALYQVRQRNIRRHRQGLLEIGELLEATKGTLFSGTSAHCYRMPRRVATHTADWRNADELVRRKRARKNN